MLDGADPRSAVIQAQHGGKPGVDHMIEPCRDIDPQIGAAEDDAVIHGRRAQGHVDAQAGMQTHADAANRLLQRPLTPCSRIGDQIQRQSVHAPRLVQRQGDRNSRAPQ
jgi:hypothetical protein